MGPTPPPPPLYHHLITQPSMLCISDSPTHPPPAPPVPPRHTSHHSPTPCFPLSHLSSYHSSHIPSPPSPLIPPCFPFPCLSHPTSIHSNVPSLNPPHRTSQSHLPPSSPWVLFSPQHRSLHTVLPNPLTHPPPHGSVPPQHRSLLTILLISSPILPYNTSYLRPT